MNTSDAFAKSHFLVTDDAKSVNRLPGLALTFTIVQALTGIQAQAGTISAQLLVTGEASTGGSRISASSLGEPHLNALSGNASTNGSTAGAASSSIRENAIGGTHLKDASTTDLQAIGGTHLKAIGGTHLKDANSTDLQAIGGTHLKAIGGTHLKDASSTDLQAIGGTHLKAIGGTHLKDASSTDLQAIGGTHLKAIGGTHLKDASSTELQAIGGTHLKAIGGTHLKDASSTDLQAIGGTHLKAIGGTHLKDASSTDLQAIGGTHLKSVNQFSSGTTGVTASCGSTAEPVQGPTLAIGNASYDYTVVGPISAISSNGSSIRILGQDIPVMAGAVSQADVGLVAVVLGCRYDVNQTAVVYRTADRFTAGSTPVVLSGIVEKVDPATATFQIAGYQVNYADLLAKDANVAIAPGDAVIVKGDLFE